MEKPNLSEAKRKEIFRKALLDKTFRENLLKDPEGTLTTKLAPDDIAAIERMKAALPVFDSAIDSLSGTVLCAPFGGPCGIA